MNQEKKSQLLARLLENSYIPICQECKKVTTKDGKYSRMIKYIDILEAFQEFFPKVTGTEDNSKPGEVTGTE